MAGHRKYFTEEERRAANNEAAKRSRAKRIMKEGREAVSNPCKHKYLNLDCIKIDVGTLNRTYINTAYIDMLVTIAYTEDEPTLRKFCDNARASFNDWLRGQDMWDKRIRLMVTDYSIHEAKRYYTPKSKSISIQLHVRREEVTDWKSTLENLQGLVDTLVDTIKKTCDETGLPLRRWKDNCENEET